jgi:hypothetical protein
MLEEDEFEAFKYHGASSSRLLSSSARAPGAAAQRGQNSNDLLASIRAKFSEHRVRAGDVIHECREIDHNEDFIVHSHNLYGIIEKLFPRNTFTKVELAALSSALEPHGMKGFVEYSKLKDVLAGSRDKGSERCFEGEEKWMDDESVGPKEGTNKAGFGRGSLGDWLMHAGCPAERANFQDLISCLEMYERYSGMRISQSPDGEFLIPVGPGLKATLRFTTTK